MRTSLFGPLLLSMACGAATPAGHASGHPGGHASGHHRDFKDAEGFAKLFDDPARDAWQRPGDVVKLLALEPGMIVADLGAGTGYFLPHLAPAVAPGGQVLALDVEPEMVRYMEQRIARESLANVTARVVPSDGPGLGAGSVDRVLIVNTYHHLGEREAYARALRTALRPGGRVVIVDFTEDSPHGPPPAMRLSSDVVKRELKAAGFAVELAVEELPYQYVLIAKSLD